MLHYKNEKPWIKTNIFFLVTIRIRLMIINFKLFFTTNEVEDCGWCTIKNDANENNVKLIIICRLNKM